MNLDYYKCVKCNSSVYPSDEAVSVGAESVDRRYYHRGCYDSNTLKRKLSIIGSARNPWLNQVLSKIAKIHDKKNHDYCPDDNNPFFNFEVAASYNTAILDHKLALPSMALQSFNTLLGVKLARLYALLTRGTQPNNEAFIDSEWDYVVYFLLRESYKLKLEGEKGDMPKL